MDGDWQRWFLVTCPLWTRWLLLLYSNTVSIYNIQRHVSIKSLIFFKLWITLYCKVSGNFSANNEPVAKTLRICKNFPVSIADTLTGFFWLWAQVSKKIISSHPFNVTQEVDPHKFQQFHTQKKKCSKCITTRFLVKPSFESALFSIEGVYFCDDLCIPGICHFCKPPHFLGLLKVHQKFCIFATKTHKC